MSLLPNPTSYTGNDCVVPTQVIRRYLKKDKPINGIIHIGSHECQESKMYLEFGIGSNRTIWIDAIPKKVDQAVSRGYRVFHGVVTDVDDQDIIFHVSSNEESSSIFDLGTHKQHHGHIHYVEDLKLKTTTLPTLINRNSLDIAGYNFINLDIQGAELKALKGMESLLGQIDYIYCEANEEELYVGCALIHQIDEYLMNFGFKRMVTYMTKWKWGDALYVKV